MRYAAWDARMSKPDQSGVSARDHYRAAAARGSQTAIAELDGPPFPEALRYLWDWYKDIRRGLGAGMDGIASLTWVVLDAWSRHSGEAPAPHEVDALFSLDVVTRNPDALGA